MLHRQGLLDATNGVIHVIDKVLTPPVDDPFEGVDSAVLSVSHPMDTASHLPK